MTITPGSDVSRISIRVQPAAGGRVLLYHSQSIRSVSQASDGQFRLIGVIGENIEAQLWETLGADQIFRGRLAVTPDATAMTVDLQAPGRWVDIDVQGGRQDLDVYVGGVSFLSPVRIATLIVGSTARLWIPDAAGEVSFMRGQAMKSKSLLAAGATFIGVTVND